MSEDAAELTIRDISERTGVGQPTLRMWESRYGFPEPQRRPSGHRRYSDRDIELVQQVLRDRASGLSLKAAIERARGAAAPAEDSIFAGLRRRRPDLQPHVLRKRTLIALSHAIEDECCARAEHPLLFGSFQRVPFFRHAEARWRELARTADLALVFADFEELRREDGEPVQVPIEATGVFAREWSLVCDAPDYTACLSAWEHPGQEGVPDGERAFETIWSVEPEIVRTAARIAGGLAERAAPGLLAPVEERLAESPPPSGDEMRVIGSLTNRMVAYIGRSEVTTLPAPHSSAEG